MTNANPYVQTLLEKGYTVAETRQVKATTKTFPCVIHGRTFETEADYQEALADYINGL